MSQGMQKGQKTLPNCPSEPREGNAAQADALILPVRLMSDFLPLENKCVLL